MKHYSVATTKQAHTAEKVARKKYKKEHPEVYNKYISEMFLLAGIEAVMNEEGGNE